MRLFPLILQLILVVYLNILVFDVLYPEIWYANKPGINYSNNNTVIVAGKGKTIKLLLYKLIILFYTRVIDEEESFMFSKVRVKDGNGKVIIDSKIPNLVYVPGGYQFQGKWQIINNEFIPIRGILTSPNGDVYEGKLLLLLLLLLFT